jgi:hypothetical protein
MDVLPVMDVGLAIDKLCDREIREYKQGKQQIESIKLRVRFIHIAICTILDNFPDGNLFYQEELRITPLGCDGENMCTPGECLGRFGGFLLLAALLHRSLHRRTGRVPPLKH